jgi:DNA-binding transcriptional LysR family regulator
VEVRLRYDGSVEQLENVASGLTDVALVVATGPVPQGVRLRAVSSQKLVVLCHPDHPFAGEKEIDIESLQGQSMIGFQPGWGAQVLSRRAFAAAGFDYRTSMEVNDVHPLLDLVGYNLGVAIVPASFAAKRPDSLRAVALPEDMPEWTVAVAVADEPSPAATAFLDQLFEETPQAISSIDSSSAVRVTSAA